MKSTLERLGTHLIVGLSGPALSKEERHMLKKLKPAGVLLFTRNFLSHESYPDWMDTLRTLLSDVHECTHREKMIVSIDHEGGRVVRTPAPITRFPYACQYRALSRRVGEANGRELASIGINLSFAPCTDVHSNPLNPVIGNRAFSTSPEDTAILTKEYLEGMQSMGVLGCAKHFPGHGDTETDSHFDLPVLNLSMNDLERRELIPFRSLFDAGVPTVMTAHIYFPDIDNKNPVTLSKAFLQSKLRDEYGFSGVVISDDLEMKAVSERFKRPGTLGNAFKAGNDMFIIANSPGAEPFIDILSNEFERAFIEGEITEQLLQPAVDRVEALINRCQYNQVKELDKSVFDMHQNLIWELANQ